MELHVHSGEDSVKSAYVIISIIVVAVFSNIKHYMCKTDENSNEVH
jgi:hypothetical protein